MLVYGIRFKIFNAMRIIMTATSTTIETSVTTIETAQIEKSENTLTMQLNFEVLANVGGGKMRVDY
jgi:hypothetical protein